MGPNHVIMSTYSHVEELSCSKYRERTSAKVGTARSGAGFKNRRAAGTRGVSQRSMEG